MPRGEFDRSARRARTRSQLLEAAAHAYVDRGVDAADARRRRRAGRLHEGRRVRPLRQQGQPSVRSARRAPGDADRRADRAVRRQSRPAGTPPDRRRPLDRPPRIGPDRAAAVRRGVGQGPARRGRASAALNAALEPMREMFRDFGRRRAAERGEHPSEAPCWKARPTSSQRSGSGLRCSS